MTYHPVAEQITNMLKAHDCWFETFQHEPVRTSEEASKVRTGYGMSQGAKALITRISVPEEGKKFVMFIVPGNCHFDQNKLKKLFGMKDIRFASEQEVGEITGGVLPGGVPPFGNLFHLAVYADQRVFDNEKIVFNAGDRSFSVGMKSADYRRLVSPQVADFAEVV